MVAPKVILSAVELAYFVPVLPLAILLVLRHGFSKKLGWLSMIILSLFRISGASTQIAAVYKPSSGLITATLVLQSFGLASIVVCCQGLLNRLSESVPLSPFYPPRVFKVLHLTTTAAIIMAIVGAVEISDATAGNDPTAHTLQRVAVLLFLGVACVLLGLYINMRRQSSSSAATNDKNTDPNAIPATERPLLIALSVSLPLIIFSLIFRILGVFNIDPNLFNILSTSNKAVIVQALTIILQEFIIVAVVLWAGFTVPKLAKKEVYAQEEEAR